MTLIPAVLLLFSLFLLACAPSSEKNDRTFSPSPQPLATTTPLDIASQNFANEWKSRYVELKAEIESQRTKWAANPISSYSFEASKYRGGHRSVWNRSPVLIKVVDGRAVSRELVDKTDVSEMARTDGFEEFDTVDRLFDYMTAELDAGRIVTAKYDPNLNFPSHIEIAEWVGPHGFRSILIDKLKISGEPQSSNSATIGR